MASPASSLPFQHSVPHSPLSSWHQAYPTQLDKRQKATLRGSWLCWKIYRLPGSIVHSAGRHITLPRRQLLRKKCNTHESVARSVSWLTETGRKFILSQNWWCGCCFQVKKADQGMGLWSGSFRTSQTMQSQRKRRTRWDMGCGFGGYLGAFCVLADPDISVTKWLISHSEGLLWQPRVRQRLSLPGSSSLNGSCICSFHFHSAASQSYSWLNLPRSLLGKVGRSLGKGLLISHSKNTQHCHNAPEELTLLFQVIWWSGIIKGKIPWASFVAGRTQSRTVLSLDVLWSPVRKWRCSQQWLFNSSAELSVRDRKNILSFGISSSFLYMKVSLSLALCTSLFAPPCLNFTLSK